MIPNEVVFMNYNPFLFQVNATDLDSGSLGTVRYSITSEQEESLFIVDPVSGDLYANGVLDRETKDAYSLTIAAKDQGK